MKRNSLPALVAALAFCAMLTGCQKGGSSAVAEQAPSDQSTPEEASSILSLWQNGTKTLDFRNLTLEQEMSADLVLVCNGSFGNNGKVNGMARGNVKLTGTNQKGYLMVGHLKYNGATDHTCSDMSKELYSYAIDGQTLTFCTLNWDACGTYTRAP